MNFHWRDGNRLQLLENGEEFFPAVFEAIAAAEKEVPVSYTHLTLPTILRV
jgi:cardiolipin synthase